MDPVCPQYGKEPLPLPASMDKLFPVSQIYSNYELFTLLFCLRDGRMRRKVLCAPESSALVVCANTL